MPDSKRKSLGGEQQYNKVDGGHNIAGGDGDCDGEGDDEDESDDEDDQMIAFIKVPAEDAGYGALEQAAVEVKILLSNSMIISMVAILRSKKYDHK